MSLSTMGRIKRAIGQVRDAGERGSKYQEYNEGFGAGYEQAPRRQVKEQYEGKDEEERKAYRAGYKRGSGHNLTTE